MGKKILTSIFEMTLIASGFEAWSARKGKGGEGQVEVYANGIVITHLSELA